jgi:hypothetical protein
MSKKLIYLISFVLVLGSVSNAEDIQWTDLGADHLWSTPENWDLGRVPTLADDVRIDVPAAGAPNGPVIQDGIDAKANGIFTEAAGEPTLTMTGGTLEVAEWIWWGDGTDSFGIWDMSGGTVSVANEFELGWGGGAGTLTMTGGTISAGEAVIPTGSGAFGELYLYGGTYNVTTAGGLSVKENGLIDITEGTLVLEGDDTAKVNDLIAAGLITAYGGDGQLELDFDGRNPGKTTLTATIEKTVLFEEDFEGLALGPNVDEALAGDAVWTDTPPDGWSIDSDIPGLGNPATDGVAEWAGWAFTDKEWWTQAAEDQDRSLFELGDGTIAVADPDEWDDADRLPIPISADPYDTWLSTPAIGISGCEPGTLQLKFDSSWRPEFDDNYHQTANITASFDDGEPVVVMLWESDENSANYKPYATNETVIVNLDNPEGAKSVVLTFGLFDAGNDWWWAIDNVEVSGVILEQDPVDPGTEGLAAYYPLENDVLDASGNGNDGTIVGDPTFVEGVAGMAMEFNGDDYVNCGNGPSLQIQDAITMAFWFQVEAFQNTWEAFMAKGDNSYRTSRGGGTGDATHMGISGTSVGGGSGWFNGTVIVTGGQWHHMAAVYDGSEGRIYIDGVLDVTSPGTGQINISNYDFWIGNNSQQTGRFFHGLLDEVMIYDRALSDPEIRYLAGERAKPVDPGTDGLVAYYAFENNADDSSGNELHGTLVGDAKFAEGPAGYGMALDLDGDGDYVDCGTPPQLDITEQITFTYWIKAVALDKSWNTVLSRGDDSWRSSRAGTNNFMEAAVGGTSGNYLYGVTPVDDDKWHHVGAVYDGATFSLYVDGGLDASEESTGSITASSYPLLIGENAQATGRFWTGLIDEVVIYNRALSVGEIRYLAGKRAVDPSLVIYYSFDEVGEIVADQSGKGHDGVVVGDVTAEPEGMYGGAANFASGSYLDLDGPSFPAEDIPTSAMTLAAWIKCANTGGDHEIFSARASDNTWLIHPEPKSSGDIRWLLRSYGGTTIFQIRAGTMTWDEWLHFAGTYDKESAKAALYINGELIEEMDVASPDDIAGDWGLGARVGLTIDDARPFTGLMDEFRMYTRALSQDEILEIMQGM